LEPYRGALKVRWGRLTGSERNGWARRVPLVLDWSWIREGGVKVAGGLWKGPSCLAGGQAGYGVVAARALDADVRLGRYEGDLFKGVRKGQYIIQPRFGGHYYIDGGIRGNWTRWVQHGFQGGGANLKLVVEGHGKETRAYLHTRRAIAAGEELFWEYGTRASLEGQDWFSPGPHVPVAEQLCGNW
jgi:hypothetical protein